MKHLPGPWKVTKTVDMDGIENGARILVTADRQIGTATHTDCLAQFEPRSYAKLDQDMANATLIASAPMLLEALKRIITDDIPYVHDANSCECGDFDSLGECSHVNAFLVIAEAEGNELV